ncbi:MAG: ABC transporter permease subunit [Bacteroidales bacterium]|nr:ABC transporter permease subunit [Bacteroidales bacterium]
MRLLETFSTLLIVIASLACTRTEEVFQPQSFDELPGHTMALMEGSAQAEYAELHFRDKGVNLVYFPGFTDGMIAVRQNRADVLFANLLMTYNDAFKEQHLKICRVVDELVADTGYGIKKGNDALKNELNTFLDSLITAGALKEKEERWLSDPDTDPHDLLRFEPIPANPSGEGKLLKVGVSGSQPPATMLVDNKWTGYEIEILQEFAATRGYQLQIQVYDFHNLIPALSSGTIDIIASTLIINEERKQKIDFSVITFKLKTAFISRDPDYTAGTGLWQAVKKSAYASLIKDSRWKLILNGLLLTVIITLCSLILGAILGGVVCSFRMSGRKWKSSLAKGYIYIMRNTPILVFLMIMFYVVFANSGLSATAVAIIAFSMNSGAFIAEIYRSGIQSVPKGQIEAGRAMGCSAFKCFLYIVAPQAAKTAMPVLTSECITLLKGTSIVGYISIIDLTKASDLIRSTSFEAFFPLLTITLLYFILATLLTHILNAVLNKL